MQSIAADENLRVGYSDEDIAIIDNVRKLVEPGSAHVKMNLLAICTNGRAQGIMNGQPMTLKKNQVAIFPSNMTVTDLMVSPDFELKAMFFTSRILQSFLREKMALWNEMLYVHRMYLVTLSEEDIAYFTHFYEMLRMVVGSGRRNPFQTEVVQSLLRSAFLALCGRLKEMLPTTDMKPVYPEDSTTAAKGYPSVSPYFQRFLDLLSSSSIKHRSVESYAAELCISPKYLSVICKRCSGKTANEWITEHVIEDIRYYLKQTDLSIKQICDRLGFPNSSFFGRYVKDHFGMPPSQFRNL